jgi:hypothetical protein
MFSWDEPKDRVAIVQLNADLRHAELELLSAQCATDRLRLRFSPEDVASFGQQDVLQKAIRAATAINDYYASIHQRLPKTKAANAARNFSDQQIKEAVKRISEYLRQQRENYFPLGDAIGPQDKLSLQAFFASSLLDQVRILELRGARVPNPPFYADATDLGFSNFPQMTHMASLTFLDVIVFNERISSRALFHGLVHAVQFLVLGLERYTELFVRGFLRTQLHVTVPLEAQAFLLESRFQQDPRRVFSVEDQVRLWADEGRY